MILRAFDGRAAQAEALAEAVAEDLSRALEARGTAHLAVPGGSTPATFLTALGGQALDWSRVVVTLTDERQVAADDARSNARLVRETLLVGATDARFLPLWTGEYAGDVAEALPLDVAVLGMGADMHTASLFPDAKGLEAALADGATVAVVTPAGLEPRVTLSGPVLRAAGRRYLLIQGEEKRAALDRARAASDVLEAPVRVVLVDGDPPTEVYYAA
ncbi:MAG: 6-phosphogluconolactonase [Pseudomonadota bacterium]